ncbi:MAG TPA: hypothetical protein VMD76_00660 [Candidatus Sulfotelmatobacter sp.]|nr:hypothetical protein [Candidatus Sulfotelmatobacter sp.]
MMKSRLWILSVLLVIASVVGRAEEKDGTKAKSAASTATSSAGQPATNPNVSVNGGNANVTALLGVLVMKGVLTAAEGNAIRDAAPEKEFQLLVDALARKGVVTAADLAPASTGTTAAASAAAVSAVPAVVQVAAQTVAAPAKIAPPAVISAVTPLRVLPVDPPVRDGLIPSFKVGAVKVTPYGFIKTTVVHDSSDPNGDDFPYPGIWLNSSSVLSTGPTQDPSFHIKARASRFGANFEWLDISPKISLTGRVEGDFEGGFSEVDNADVSSIRNPTPRLRLAYVRMDYAVTSRSDVFFEGGQNWSLFGSTALPNILETTFLGAYSGDIWERTPQFRFGLVQKLGTSDRDFKFTPEFALMMPSSGEIYKLNGTLGGFEAQIGEGEREGADSGRPEVEARALLQFRMDEAPGVAPGALIWSGYQGRRTSISTNTNIAGLPADFKSQFAGGITNSSSMYGNQIAVQVPTRWFTFVASGYRGGDMRFMLAGQLNTYYTDTAGLYNVANVPTVDGVTIAAGGMAVGCSVAIATGSSCTGSGGTWKIAPQKPIGAFGGFLNLGLPLSRWAHADPKGHNAGWQLYLHAGKDQVVHKDLAFANGFGCGAADGSAACTGGLPLSQSRLLAATLYYKLNNWATFAFEQSQYQTTLLPEIGAAYNIAGTPATKWKDQRTEFGPIFTF